MNRRNMIAAGVAGISATAAITNAEAADDNPELEKIKELLAAHDKAMTAHDLDGVLACLANDMGLHLMETRIENIVLHTFLLEEVRQQFGFLNRHSAHQNRLPDLVLLCDRLCNRDRRRSRANTRAGAGTR